jgi:NAD-dependent DNA ligase
MVFFLITIALCILVIRTRTSAAISTENLIKLPRNEKETTRIIGTVASVEKIVCDITNTKARDLRFSIYSLGISIIMLIFYSILSF